MNYYKLKQWLDSHSSISHVFKSELSKWEIHQFLNEYDISRFSIELAERYILAPIPYLTELLNNLNIKRNPKMNIQTHQTMADLLKRLEETAKGLKEAFESNDKMFHREEPNEQYKQGDFILIEGPYSQPILTIVSGLNSSEECFNLITLERSSNRFFGSCLTKEQLNQNYFNSKMLGGCRTIKKLSPSEAITFLKKEYNV